MVLFAVGLCLLYRCSQERVQEKTKNQRCHFIEIMPKNFLVVLLVLLYDTLMYLIYFGHQIYFFVFCLFVFILFLLFNLFGVFFISTCVRSELLHGTKIQTFLRKNSLGRGFFVVQIDNIQPITTNTRKSVKFPLQLKCYKFLVIIFCLFKIQIQSHTRFNNVSPCTNLFCYLIDRCSRPLNSN